jgi:predicted permease
MLEVFLRIAPVFVLIIAGNLLRRNGIPSIDFWNLNDRLVYWVLFPALLFNRTAVADISAVVLGPFALAILGGFFASCLFAVCVCLALRIPGPSLSSILQGSARHNTFIALAVTDLLFGAEGLTIAALATAILVPVTNLVMVSALSISASDKGETPLWRALLRDLLRNPLIVSIALGLFLNLSGIGAIPVLHQATGILGQAALPIVLLCIGANLTTDAVKLSALPFVISSIGKFAIFPAASFWLAQTAGLTGTSFAIVMIYALVPTATSAYTLARQLGGDAPLMASLISLQTLLSLILLPLSIALLIGI